MNNNLLQEQVATIRQSFGYVREFKDAIFVIKIDSTLMKDPYFPIFIRDVVLLHNAGIKVVLIPGTRVRIDEILSSFTIPYHSVEGVRISTEEAIPFIKMAAFDVSNQIMTLLAENSANAVIGNWVRARSIGVRNGTDYQSTGMIDKVDSDSILKILNDNMIPIFPNIGWSLTGKPYNISSNELALKISAELKASKLFFITDCGGVTGSPYKLPPNITSSQEGFISQLTVQEATEIIELNPTNIYQDTNLQLLNIACKAATNGVQRVHIIDGRVDGILLKEIFSNRGYGTMIYTNQHENIRPIVHQDIPDIMKITADLVKKGVLIARDPSYIEIHISEYVVYEVDNTIHGSGALKEYEAHSAEIYSIAVDSTYASMGIGKRIISYLIQKALSKGYKTLFLLTTQTTDWFVDRGFYEGSIEDLPPQKAAAYNMERKSRVLLLDLTKPETYSNLVQL